MMKILSIVPGGQGGTEVFARRMEEYIVNHKIINIHKDLLYSLYQSFKSADLILIHRAPLIKKILIFWGFDFFRKKVILFQHIIPGGSKKDLYHRFVYGKLAGVLGASKSIVNFILKNWPVDHKKVKLMYCGIPVEKFVKIENRSDLRRKFGIPENSFVVGVVGKIMEGKNQKLLAEAVKLCDYNKIFCVVAGPVESWKYYEEIRKAFAKIPHLIIPRFLSEVNEVFCTFDISVITSKFEAFGLVGLESLACKVPVISPDNAGVSEVLEDGKDSFIYKNNDPVSLSSKLVEAFERKDELPKMGDYGRQKVELNFSMQKFSAEFDRVLSELIGTS